MKEKKKNLYEYLSEIEDYRRAEWKKHKLPNRINGSDELWESRREV